MPWNLEKVIPEAGKAREIDVNFTYENIISYAEQKSKVQNENLENANNFIKLSAKYYNGNEKDLFKRLKDSNKTFKLWGISILAENKSIESIPLLLDFIIDIDAELADRAYNALKTITGMDPGAALDKRINDPDIIAIFKEYYLMHSQIRKV